jgi:transposase InsO family protein
METRRVRLAGVTVEPVAGWVGQQARNLCFDLSEEGQQARFLIRDNDTKFTAAFDRVLAADGMGVIRTPIRAPRANSVAERFVGTVRRECLDRLLILGRRHLEAVLAEYVEHYNGHRPHRFLDQRPPCHGSVAPIPIVDLSSARLRRTAILDGLIHEYSRAA